MEILNDRTEYYRKMWGIFDALTCDTPELADIEEWMLPPFSEGDIRKMRKANRKCTNS